MKKFIATFIATATLAFSAAAMDLATARSQGLVGETTAGYVARISGGGEVSQLVADVNAKRRSEYERISGENGQPVDVVAKLAYPQIVSNLPKGAHYKDEQGNWVKK